MTELSDRDKAILDFEREFTWWEFAGNKEREVRTRFDLSMTLYHLALVGILKMPAADAYDPFTVRRLRALVARRRSTPDP